MIGDGSSSTLSVQAQGQLEITSGRSEKALKNTAASVSSLRANDVLPVSPKVSLTSRLAQENSSSSNTLRIPSPQNKVNLANKVPRIGNASGLDISALKPMVSDPNKYEQPLTPLTDKCPLLEHYARDEPIMQS